MLRKVMLFLSCLSIYTALAIPASAQDGEELILPANRFSFGAGFGITDAWTDIGTESNADHYANPYYWEHLQFMGALHLRYRLSPSFTLRLSGGYGRLFASDMFNKEEANKSIGKDFDVYQRYTRNLDFRTNIYEATLLLEAYPFRWFKGSGAARSRLQPILLIGLGYFHFNPEASYEDPLTGRTEWVKTQELHLEGEGLPYKGAPAAYDRNQITTPIGMGLNWQLSESVAVGLEYLYRKAGTDYLDGVSNRYVDPVIFDQYLTPEKAAIAYQLHNKTTSIDPDVARQPGDPRGSPKANDAFSTISFTIFLTLKPYDAVRPVRY